MIPLLLTFTRIIVTPLIAYLIYVHSWLYAFGLFSIAALSDILDGFFARLLNQQTELGACLDPLADKFLIISCYSAFLVAHDSLIIIPGWFVVFVLLKEFVQISAVIYLRFIHNIIYIKPTILGKATTVVQSGFIVLCCLSPYLSFINYDILSCMVAIAVLLNIVTLVHYGLIAYNGWCSWNISK